jgi:hypothetical protein
MTYVWCDGIMASYIGRSSARRSPRLDGGWREFLEMKDWVGQFNSVLSSSLGMP